MSGKTNIAWTNATWNVLGGCSPVSMGCANCAASTCASRRLSNHPLYKGLTKNGKWTGEIRLCTDIGREDILEQPLHWRSKKMIFVEFMGDLFHEKIPFEFIDRIFAVMALCPQHIFQVLTKRPERMAEYFTDVATSIRVDRLKYIIAAGRLNELDAPERTVCISGWPGYAITSKGRVLSDWTNAGKRCASNLHEIKPQPGADGHARVQLYKEGESERELVYRLVLSNFDRPPSGNEQGCHIDGDTTRNALWNLRWGTQEDNWADSKRHGTRRRYSKLTLESVEQIRERYQKGESSGLLAHIFGVSDVQILNIVTNKQWKPEYKPEWPLQNTWIGCTCENQEMADKRIPILLQIPAAKRFVSVEPCLDFIELRLTKKPIYGNQVAHFSNGKLGEPENFIDWIILGCESGPHRRKCDDFCLRNIIRQADEAGVPVFVKQIEINGKVSHNTNEWPIWARRQEFPK
jgi:protein gp37